MKTTRSLCLASLLAALHPLLAAGASSEATPFSTHVGDPVSIPAEIADHVIFMSSARDEYGPIEDMFSVLMHAVLTYLTQKRGKKLYH